MLASFTPEEFRELWAANYLQPIADEWRQTGEICAAIINAAMMANRTQPLREDQLVTWEEFVPTLECLRKPKQETTRPITSEWARRNCGG